MAYRYVCNGFLRQIRLGRYQLALPVPGILRLCNYLQNVGVTTYILGLQLSTFMFYNKHIGKVAFAGAGLARNDKVFTLFYPLASDKLLDDICIKHPFQIIDTVIKIHFWIFQGCPFYKAV